MRLFESSSSGGELRQGSIPSLYFRTEVGEYLRCGLLKSLSCPMLDLAEFECRVNGKKPTLLTHLLFALIFHPLQMQAQMIKMK